MHDRRTRRTRAIPAQHRLNAPYPRLWVRTLAAILVGLLLFFVTSGALLALSLQSAIKVSKANEFLDRGPSDSYSGRAVNILVLGSDTRKGEGNTIDDSEQDSERSDTTMLMHISRDRTRATVVSIPRDLIVDIPACNLGNGKQSKPQTGQFNWAFAVGGQGGSRDAAVACTIKTTEKLTGVTIDDYVVVDFNGFRHMVDALGGIRVYVDQPIKDWHTSLDIDKGCYTMDGNMALAYARVRHGVKGGDGTDTQRIARQQHVVSIMMREALSRNLLTNVPSLYEFARAGLSALETSPSLSDLSVLSGLAYSLRAITPAQVTFLSMPTQPYPADPNRVIPTEHAQPLWAALREDTPLPPGLEVKDGTGRAFVTEVPQPPPTAPADQAGTGATDQGATPAPDASDNPDTTAPDSSAPSTEQPVDETERARAECETKGQ